MSEGHVDDLRRALGRMRGQRRLTAKALAKDYQRGGTTTQDIERLMTFQRVINALIEAIDDEQRQLSSSPGQEKPKPLKDSANLTSDSLTRAPESAFTL